MSVDSPRIVVVGASAAGLRAAARARRLLPRASITVLDRSAEISVSACGLPYYLSGDIEDIRALRRTTYGALRDERFFAEIKGLEVRTGFLVDRLDLDRRAVHGRDLASGAPGSFPYDFLVLATGSEALRVPGMAEGSSRARCLRTSEDARILRSGLERGRTGSLLVIGGGFIGCEAAEAGRALWGARVELVEAAPQVLPYLLDGEMAAVVEAELRRQETTLHLHSRVERVVEDGEGVTVVTDRGELRADAAVCALGVRPAVGFAAAAGLATGPHGGLLVDEQLRTSRPEVFAGGDCVELVHHVTGRPVYLPLGSLANRQGRLIGNLLAGREGRLAPLVGSSAVRVFECHVASTGATAEAARRSGLRACEAWGTFEDRASYHPESRRLHLKLVYEEETRRLLGLQAVGSQAAVRETDLFASLLQRGGRVEELLDLEFAYAPVYAPALDPMCQLAALALNREEDGVAWLAPDGDPAGREVIDVREEGEEAEEPSGLERRLALPLGRLRERLAGVPPGRPLLFVCSRGTRSYEAARIMRHQGHPDALYLAGGVQLRVPAGSPGAGAVAGGRKD